jgi:hypothetical protein
MSATSCRSSSSLNLFVELCWLAFSDLATTFQQDPSSVSLDDDFRMHVNESYIIQLSPVPILIPLFLILFLQVELWQEPPGLARAARWPFRCWTINKISTWIWRSPHIVAEVILPNKSRSRCILRVDVVAGNRNNHIGVVLIFHIYCDAACSSPQLFYLSGVRLRRAFSIQFAFMMPIVVLCTNLFLIYLFLHYWK